MEPAVAMAGIQQDLGICKRLPSGFFGHQSKLEHAIIVPDFNFDILGHLLHRHIHWP